MPCRCNSASVASASQTNTAADAYTNNSGHGAHDGFRRDDAYQRAPMAAVQGTSTNNNNNAAFNRCGRRDGTNAIAGVSTTNDNNRCRTSFWPVFAVVPNNSSNDHGGHGYGGHGGRGGQVGGQVGGGNYSNCCNRRGFFH
ncbi:hypothetical protein SDC9_126612 [bioreactor metagenome]|uniref:Uncharacterized protein n=1 Tax=bioreactor metagenome TaxID=1076179 RepID=A0A645CRN8_9ZZZZ